MQILCRTDLPGGLVVITARYKENDYETFVDHPPYKDRRKYYELQPSKTAEEAMSDHRRFIEKWIYKVTTESPGTFGPADYDYQDSPELDYIFGPASGSRSGSDSPARTQPAGHYDASVRVDSDGGNSQRKSKGTSRPKNAPDRGRNRKKQ